MLDFASNLSCLSFLKDAPGSLPGVLRNIPCQQYSADQEQRPKVPWYHQMVAGAIAGGAAAVFVSPQDVARVRIQVSHVDVSDSGLFGIKQIRRIVAEEGFSAQYKGQNANFIAQIPNWMAYFVVYNEYRSRYSDLKNTIGQVPFDVSAAVVAGCASTIVTHPLWLIKARMQVQGLRIDHPTVSASKVAANVSKRPGLAIASIAAVANISPSHSTMPLVNNYTEALHHCMRQETRSLASSRVPHLYDSTWQAIRIIIRTEGPLALYQGLAAQMFGLVHSAIHFPCYEATKRYIRKYNGDQRLTTSQIIAASVISKVLACAVAYPHEVIRSRFQTQEMFTNVPQAQKQAMYKYTSVLGAVKQIVQFEGIRGLYKGIAVSLFRSVPACIVTFIMYEKTIELLTKNKTQ